MKDIGLWVDMDMASVKTELASDAFYKVHALCIGTSST